MPARSPQSWRAALVSIEVSREVHPEHSEGKAGGKHAQAVTSRRPDKPSCAVEDRQNDEDGNTVAGEGAPLNLHLSPPSVRRSSSICHRCPSILCNHYSRFVIITVDSGQVAPLAQIVIASAAKQSRPSRLL